MFLRKWRFGQVAIGFLVAAFLVLGGINVVGLVQGEKAIKEADAKKCGFYLRIDLKGDSKDSAGDGPCPGDQGACFSISAGFDRNASRTSLLSND